MRPFTGLGMQSRIQMSPLLRCTSNNRWISLTVPTKFSFPIVRKSAVKHRDLRKQEVGFVDLETKVSKDGVRPLNHKFPSLDGDRDSCCFY